MSETDYLLPARNRGISIKERDGKIVDVLLLRSPPAKPHGSGRLAVDVGRYFSGERVDFDDYEVNYSGYTNFQTRVLRAARRIPYGQTRTYAEIARDAGSPGAARAVGQVMAHNRACIFVPCHRVVASNGIGGFTGGIQYKIELLELEGSMKVDWATAKRTRSRPDRRRR